MSKTSEGAVSKNFNFVTLKNCTAQGKNESKQGPFFSCIQILQVNSSQPKNDFTAILCHNFISFATWLRKDANLRFVEVNFVKYLT